MKIKGIGFVANKFFKKGTTAVIGEKGSGKDLIFGNVIHYRQIHNERNYISNLDYSDGDGYIPFNYKDIDLGGNDHINLLEGNVKYYKFPHPYGTDIYLSDAGAYLPSQYSGQLDKKYPSLPIFTMVSRQLARGSCFHFNTQQLGRAWNKIREHAFRYISCQNTIYIKLPFKDFCITEIIVYDKYESADNRVKPCRIKVPLYGNKERILQAQIAVDKFANQYGDVSRYYICYFNNSKHDTYYFEKLFENGEKNEK